MENSESRSDFSCEVKSESVDLVRGKVFRAIREAIQQIRYSCLCLRGNRYAANSSGNIQNTTQSALYECHNQRATNKTFWTFAVSLVNGVIALLILIEVICIFARARKGKKFMEDSQFWKDHLKSEQRRISRFIKSYRNSIIQDTEKLPGFRSPYQPNPGEGEGTKHATLDQMYTNLILHPKQSEI
ncbi:hypothetical protein OS493_009302 [Desmophyllum pertusum]|uniref:Uncharacterized protein n=1 Tax=Desmophyllum pertusum TaxID=174260 RepID=A0A9W9Z5Y2_9CNID|nr:hypothetical protein OS493_009302 [Desmophyllum pertusum]